VNTKRFARRAAWRGLLAAGLAGAGAVAGRRRGLAGAAAAGALVAGAAVELPVAGVAAAAVVGATVLTRPRPRDRATLAAAAAGAVAAAATTRVWPVAPRSPADIRPALTDIGTEPSEDGAGLTVVVNADAGSARPVLGQGPLDYLRAELPQAKVVEVAGEDLEAALKEAANECRVVGIAGGDGSISTAASVAHAADRPLLVVPAGTLNHLARDLGLAGPEDAVRAVREGHAVAVDVATIDDRPFVNTASFGSYGELVDARERLESRIGKWPALSVALVRVLRRAKPVRVEIDGRERRLWMIFVGNCLYHPAGFAPTWRERLDDGRLDIRLVDATTPLARTRLLLAVLTGRLGRSRVYEAFTTRELRVKSLDGPLRLARDGEVFDGSDAFVIRKEDRPLAVYVPRPDSS
jgi:undecaprenyl-diphosphatase